MYGPELTGHWTGLVAPKPFEHLQPDRRYMVSSEFTDFDGDLHPVGETWRFKSYGFNRFEDGLSLFVSLDDQREWHIRLSWTPEHQGAIIDNLKNYVRLAP